MLGNLELVSCLVLAAAPGSVIGFERERLSWVAGLRTHMLVCVGSTLIMIVSAYGFAEALGGEHIVLDRHGWPPRSSLASASWARARSCCAARSCAD